MPGSVRRSSRTPRTACLSASSGASPNSDTMITGSRGSNSATRISSASWGRSVSASIARSTSSTALPTSRTDEWNSAKIPPPPSESVVVIRSISSRSASASSTFLARPSSTSSGVAPGYGSVMRTDSGVISGKNSLVSVNEATSPPRIVPTISRLIGTGRSTPNRGRLIGRCLRAVGPGLRPDHDSSRPARPAGRPRASAPR